MARRRALPGPPRMGGTMNSLSPRLIGILLLVSVSLSAAPARASASFEFLWSSSNVTNDDQFFLHLAVGNFGYPRTVIEPCLPRLRYVEEDLPVVLFLARESGRPVEFIVDLRSGGLSWAVIFDRVAVPYDVLFVGIDQDPGPPYGKAWGYWRKHPRRLRLSDGDVRGLVQVQVGHQVIGAPAFELARARGHGKSIAVVVADRKGRPHKSEGGSVARGAGKSGEKGHGKGASHGKGGKSGKGK